MERSEKLVAENGSAAIAADFGGETLDRLFAEVAHLRNEGIKNIRSEGPQGNNALRELKIWSGNLCLYAGYLNQVINSARDARLTLAVFSVERDVRGEPTTENIADQCKYSIFVTLDDRYLWRNEDNKVLYTMEEIIDQWLLKFANEIEPG